MSNWKEVAKGHIAKADLLKAVQIMKKNINCAKFSALIEELQAQEDSVIAEKRQYKSEEYQVRSAKFNRLTFDMIQAINGTNREMPKYLK